ncbi:hypothetical protein M1K46_20940 [Fictibacillus sp. WQ 8-8]|uniref:hypothetical protein n=1 Tax=Fictibacillus sp. WQ 8-8 TaxID=2938788 RepID=UPI00210A6F49|nr:hypothetical protein [Fictibacillus sp. WQ 8-8]MCQ6268089.1 hypothetical protein [Fictibacillus sp. WQ 8-8]
MTNQQLTEELKTLIDQYANGNLRGEKLRLLKNMLFVLGDKVSDDIDLHRKQKEEEMK